MVVASIDLGQIFQVVWVSILAGLVVTTLFALVILGSAKAAECRRAQAGPAAAYVALATVSLLGVLGVAIFGITVILDKS